MRRSFRRITALAALAFAGALPSVAAAQQPAALDLTHGVASGDVTVDRAVIWSRASGGARMRVRYAEDPQELLAGRGQVSRWVRLRAGRDYTGQVDLTRLESDTVYFYRVTALDRDDRVTSAIASFVTPPERETAGDVQFAWGADVGQGLANRPPFPAFASIAAEQPDFFIFNGDTVYADSVTPAGGPASTLPEYWAKYKENRVDPLFQVLAASTSLVVGWDDHEVGNDFRGPSEPLMPIGREAFHQYWPLSVGPQRIYRSLRWGKEVELFVLDTRQYADPLEKPDGPDKTMLGEEQKRWLQAAVRESDARWKVIVTSSPLSILRSAEPPQDDWVSYETELRELLEGWRDADVRNLVSLTADVHWAQAIEYAEWGMWEFVAAPIGANPRREARPLSPTFGPRSDFIGLNERYYGSVAVDAETQTLTVSLNDEQGRTRYERRLQAR